MGPYARRLCALPDFGASFPSRQICVGERSSSGGMGSIPLSGRFGSVDGSSIPIVPSSVLRFMLPVAPVCLSGLRHCMCRSRGWVRWLRDDLPGRLSSGPLFLCTFQGRFLCFASGVSEVGVLAFPSIWWLQPRLDDGLGILSVYPGEGDSVLLSWQLLAYPCFMRLARVSLFVFEVIRSWMVAWVVLGVLLTLKYWLGQVLARLAVTLSVAAILGRFLGYIFSVLIFLLRVYEGLSFPSWSRWAAIVKFPVVMMLQILSGFTLIFGVPLSLSD
ncbi:hypothetical protein A2U01_0006515 [Trifolium medium]|uniref:Uncharacterized protein n=1 Tax=Trifolium medium TaxID=97028 RepID=A0A392MDW9_9FABA|nr:hypothetical protein [Trifolium medium]